MSQPPPRLQEEIERWTKAIAQNPKDAEAFYNRANVYYNLGQYGEAIKDYDQAIKLKQDFHWAYYHRGLAYSHLGQYERAIQDYTQAIKLDNPDSELYPNPAPFLSRADSYFKLGKYQQAIQDYDQILKRRHNLFDYDFFVRDRQPYALSQQGRAYAALGQYDKALQCFDAALELAKASAYIVEELIFWDKAKVYSLMNYPENALVWLQKCIAGVPQWREEAKTDPAFANLSSHPGFKELVEGKRSASARRRKNLNDSTAP